MPLLRHGRLIKPVLHINSFQLSIRLQPMQTQFATNTGLLEAPNRHI